MGILVAAAGDCQHVMNFVHLIILILMTFKYHVLFLKKEKSCSEVKFKCQGRLCIVMCVIETGSSP